MAQLPVHEGIEDWNKAFEKGGLQECGAKPKDYPKNDPELRSR
jgi:hypothetical protein